MVGFYHRASLYPSVVHDLVQGACAWFLDL